MFAAVLMKYFLYFETDPCHHLLWISCETRSQDSCGGAYLKIHRRRPEPLILHTTSTTVVTLLCRRARSLHRFNHYIRNTCRAYSGDKHHLDGVLRLGATASRTWRHRLSLRPLVSIGDCKTSCSSTAGRKKEAKTALTC